MTDIILPKSPKLSILGNAKTPLAQRIALATQYVSQLANLPSCPLKSSRKGGLSKCTCLHDHFASEATDALAKRVGTAIVEFSSLSKDRRNEYLMTIIKYSCMPFFGNNMRARKFVLPERDDETNNQLDNDDDSDSDDDSTLPRPI